MEGEAQPVCKFHQFGHCKFGSNCRHFHTKDTCFTTHCNQASCTARHPGHCRYFLRSSYCKFGNSCSYLHQVHSSTNSELVQDIKKIREDLSLVITTLNIKEIEITKLQDKVEELGKIISMKGIPSSGEFKCEICEYCCNSEKILKSHKSKKHKRETIREQFIHENSLELSPVHGTCVEEFNESTSISPIFQNATTEMYELYDCPLCEEGSIEKAVFKTHLTELHDVQATCDCEERIDCVLKEVSSSQTFTCTICEQVLQDEVSLTNHLKEKHKCSDKCGVCYECIDCALERRWAPAERGWFLDESGNMVKVLEDGHIVKVLGK